MPLVLRQTLFFACRRLEVLDFRPLAVFVRLMLLCIKLEFLAEIASAWTGGVLRCPVNEETLSGLVSSLLEVRVVCTASVMDALVVRLINLWEVAREL